LTRKVVVNPGELTNVNVSLFRTVWATTGTGGGTLPQSAIIRPNASGSTTNLNDVCSANWQCVDEISSDDDATYVAGTSGNWRYDRYNAENLSLSGTIDSVKIFIHVRNTGNGQQARTTIRTGGTNYNGNSNNLNGVSTYTTYSTNYALNPNSGNAWSWAEINSLQIGVGLHGTPRCTQVWAVIYYQ
jgi:hypothetical protein